MNRRGVKETTDLFGPFGPTGTSAGGIKWSDQQVAIFNHFRSRRGNLVVRARAGTGKTTTILEGVKHAPEKRILITAFNKHTAEALQERIESPNVKAKTLHSVGLGLLRRCYPDVDVDTDRGFDLAREACEEIVDRECAADNDLVRPEPVEVAQVAKFAGALKNVFPLGPNEQEQESMRDLLALVSMPEGMGFSGWTEELFIEAAVLAVNRSMSLAADGAVIDYDDMIFLPLIRRMCVARYDLVVVDEAQDMNQAQLLLAEGVLAPGGRIVVVGDDRQGIYTFRGADSNALDRLKAHYKAAELPLTVTRRCPLKVVERARVLVPDFEAAPGAPEGVLTSCATLREAVALAAPGDFMVSRLNALLVPACLALLKAGKRAYVLGKDIGEDLKALVTKIADSPSDPLEVFLPELGDWLETQAKKWSKAARSKNRKVARTAIRKLADAKGQVDVLLALAECEGVRLVTHLYVKIAALFDDERKKGDAICCSSVHRIKGLEADRVVLFEESFYVYGKLLGDREEENIEYVAITRAKRELVSIGKQVLESSAWLSEGDGGDGGA